MQTSYSVYQSAGFAGMRADNSAISVDTAVNVEASAEIPYGVMVQLGAAIADQTSGQPGYSSGTPVKLLAATTDDLWGIVMHDHTKATGLTTSELGEDGLLPAACFNVMTVGRIYVPVEEDVAPGDSVFVRAVAAGAEQAGAFRKSADGTDCIDISARARWVKSGSTSQPAILEIDMRNS